MQTYTLGQTTAPPATRSERRGADRLDSGAKQRLPIKHFFEPQNSPLQYSRRCARTDRIAA